MNKYLRPFLCVLDLLRGLDVHGRLEGVVAVVAVGYTLMGGMSSVTLTDAFQISLVMIGLVVVVVSSILRAFDKRRPMR